MKRILLLIGLFVSIIGYSQDIGNISNGESGSSTRTKLNQAIDSTNRLNDTINKYKDQLVNIEANTAKISYTDASDVGLNTTHRSSDGSDHSDVVANTAKVTNATHTGEVTGAEALTITSNVIEADNMESTNSPIDDYVWSYDAGSGGGTWVENAGGEGISYTDTTTTIGTIYNESLLEARLDDTISFDTARAIGLFVFESDTISDDASHLTKLQLYSIFDTLETESSYDSAYVYAYIDYLDSVNTVFYDSVRTALANNNLEHIAMWAAIGNQPPYFLSWEVGNYSDSILVGIASNNFQQDSIPLTTDFSSTEDGTTIGINTITINYDTVFVALDSSITESTNALLSYTSGYPALQDSSSGITTGWVDKVVTNNTTSGAYEPEYQDVLSAMTTDPTGDTLTWQNDMVKSLIDGGYWDRMDLLYIFATTDNGGNEALLNWIAPTGAQNATAVDAPTWTALEGYAGDATADYINTNYDPSTDATNFILNSATIAVYNRVEVAGNLYDMGVVSGTDQISFSSEYGSSTYSRINSNTSNTKSSSTSIGFFMTTRTSSTNVEVYRNGVSLGSETNINSTAIPSGQDLIILGRNFGGTPQDFTNNQCSIALVMDGVSDADALAINTIFETYMDNLGKGIQ